MHNTHHDTIQSGNHTLAYRRFIPSQPSTLGDNVPGIVFLGGFMSDMEGSKALFLHNFCEKHHIPFIRFDYMGHGKSSGTFAEGNLSLWIHNTLDIIDQLTEGKQLIIGSSMGGWIMLHAALLRPNKISALLGIAAAPDFTEELIWDQLSDVEKQQLQQGDVVDLAGTCNSPDEEHSPYPISWQLIEDGRKNLLLNKETLPLNMPIRLLHGMEDKDVPYTSSLKILQQCTSSDIALSLIKSGDHRMSSDSTLVTLGKTVEEIVAFSKK